MKKLIKPACLAIVFMGMAQPFYCETNDHGLNSTNLRNTITVQADGQSDCVSKGKATSDKKTKTETKRVRTDSEGNVVVWNTTHNLDPNAKYTFTVVKEIDSKGKEVIISLVIDKGWFWTNDD